ncbi:MAG: hypothetical protein HOV83_17280 [Catenulispora sp.]|nr:hypothetical protein [Catenulispora sp.]
MTMKPKPQVEEQQADPAAVAGEQAEAPVCGEPHHLALLAGVTCQRPAGHGAQEGADLGERRHEARHDGTLYAWE